MPFHGCRSLSEMRPVSVHAASLPCASSWRAAIEPAAPVCPAAASQRQRWSPRATASAPLPCASASASLTAAAGLRAPSARSRAAAAASPQARAWRPRTHGTRGPCHARAHLRCEVPVVRHEEDAPVKGVDCSLEVLARLQVQVVGRLIEDEQVGVAEQHGRDDEACLLAAGEDAYALRLRLDWETDALEHASRRLDRRLRALGHEPLHGALVALQPVRRVLREVEGPRVGRQRGGAYTERVLAQRGA
eukprot:1117131-Pleurochrysis_carterae.AAC.2